MSGVLGCGPGGSDSARGSGSHPGGIPSSPADGGSAARAAALTDTEYASPLAKCPYDLRHAAVSTWLNTGVAPTQAAEWAGHSVNALLRVYAKCVYGQDEVQGS